MAEKKMTRKEALETLIGIVEEWKSKNFAEGDIAATHTEEAIAVARKMIATIEKSNSRPKGKTSARIQNETFMKELYAKMQEHKDPVTPKWVTEHVNGVMSTQRAVWVAKVGKEWGLIKEIRIKKDVFYALADWEPPTE